MASQNEKDDIVTAKRICDELRSGNRNAIMGLYHQYHIYFTALTRRRLYENEQQQVENILSNYWIELLNSKAICGYKGKASLRTYLTGILCRRIIDANRRFARKRDFRANINDRGNRRTEPPDMQPSPEDEFLIKEKNNLIHEALLQLASVSPRDAKLIQMHFDDLSYEEMARRELQDNEVDPINLKKKTEAIKKQFTRGKTGSMAKFRRILKRCMENHSLTHTDLLN